MNLADKGVTPTHFYVKRHIFFSILITIHNIRTIFNVKVVITYTHIASIAMMYQVANKIKLLISHSKQFVREKNECTNDSTDIS